VYINRPVVTQQQPKVRVIHRCFYRDVPHICRYHTHIVNHNITRHRYIPQYTCSEQTICKDIHCGKC
jgi:hypothetical protein